MTGKTQKSPDFTLIEGLYLLELFQLLANGELSVRSLIKGSSHSVTSGLSTGLTLGISALTRTLSGLLALPLILSLPLVFGPAPAALAETSLDNSAPRLLAEPATPKLMDQVYGVRARPADLNALQANALAKLQANNAGIKGSDLQLKQGEQVAAAPPGTRCELQGGAAVCTRDHLLDTPHLQIRNGSNLSAQAAASLSALVPAQSLLNAQTALMNPAPTIRRNLNSDLRLSMDPVVHGLMGDMSRNFAVDLGRSHNGFNPTLAVVAQQSTKIMPFSFAVNGPLGAVSGSGYALDTRLPYQVSPLYRNRDQHDYELWDVSLNAAIAPGMQLNIGLNANLAGRVNAYDLAASPAYDGLFMAGSAVNSPYLSVLDGGNYIGTTLALSDRWTLRLGDARRGTDHGFRLNAHSILDQLSGRKNLSNLRSASGSVAGLAWDFADWGGVGVTAAQITEKDAFIGNLAADVFGNRSATTALGISARIGFGDGWVTTASYNEGITKLDLKPNGLLATSANLNSRAYGIAVAKHGLFGEDSLGFAVTRPIQNYAGNAAMAGGGMDNELARQRISLANLKSETDIELGYVTTFLDGALALQANAAYQLNIQGQTGNNAVSVVSRAKIKF